MKRGFQISVLLLACVMMLAHSMIPHHHHGTDICIFNLKGELIGGEKHHSHYHELDFDDENEDGHCGDKHDDHCCIDDNYLKADECKYSQMISSLGHFFIDFFGQPLLSDSENETYEQPALSTTGTPFLISYKALDVYSEGGLRAPPSNC